MSKILQFEIHASIPEKIANFYGALFGWTFKPRAPGYWALLRDEGSDPGIGGGIVQRMGAPPEGPAPVTSFICTVQVDSVDAAMQKAVELGGVVALPKMAIPGVGWLGYVKDVDGNIVGVSTLDVSAK